MKTKILLITLIIVNLNVIAQFKSQLQLKDFDIKGNDVVGITEIYVSHVKEFSKEFTKNYTFNADGYKTSDHNYSKITYQNSYEKIVQTSRDNNKEYTNFIINTPFASYLADSKQVKTNSKGEITNIFFKSKNGDYDSNLDFIYGGNLIMTKPDVDYLYLNIYTDKGLLIKELNKSMGNYFNAYDAKTNLQTVQVFNNLKDPNYDLHTIYLYEFDTFGNWIVKYKYESSPIYGNKLDNLREIKVRELTYKNGSKTGYNTINQELKNKGLAKIKTLNIEKFDKANFPIYYEYKEKLVTNNTSDNKCEGDCQNGWGKYTHNSGYYDGFWENGQKSGYGMYKWTNGNLYLGNWYQDKMSGFGQTIFSNGNEYSGGFSNGKYHGYAIVYKKADDKNQYNKYADGEFTEAVPMNNYGVTKGCTHGNCENGYGRYAFDNGDIFIGEFKRKGLYMGVYYFSNGDIYQGTFNFTTNTFGGYGYYKYKESGDFYKGNWADGKRNGKGLTYTKNKLTKAEWKDNQVVKTF